MEYAPGGELFNYIVDKGQLSEDESKCFFKQLIYGAEYLHKIKVSHRDLKPENLLLDLDHNIKIVDFGLSNRFEANSLLQTACGSPCYAPPEMIAGKKYDGAAVDVWSSGVILFVMICGYLPFEDEHISRLYKKILKGKFDIPNNISNAAKDLITGMLKTDPNERYTIEQIKIHPWMTQDKMINWKYEPQPKFEIDNKIIKKMTEYNFTDEAKIRFFLKENWHNRETVVYYLIKTRIYNRSKELAKIFMIDNKEELSDCNSKLTHKDINIDLLERSFSFTKSLFYLQKTKEFTKGEVSVVAATNFYMS